MVSACILVRTQRGKFKEAVRTIEKIKTVNRVFPVLGRYDIVVDVESTDAKKLGADTLRISKISGVVFTETLMEIQN